MVLVHFVRHGRHDRLDHMLCGRMAGVRLGEAGRGEALRAASRLAGEGVSRIFSSPLERARETAAPIAEAAGAPVEIQDDINEIDLGEWTGLSFEALRAREDWRVWNAGRAHARAPGGESMLEVAARTARFLETAGAAGDGAVAAVCHADVVKAALCHALGLSLDHHHRLTVAPGSISTVRVEPWGLSVERVNLLP